jgi:hypothetical protein
LSLAKGGEQSHTTSQGDGEFSRCYAESNPCTEKSIYYSYRVVVNALIGRAVATVRQDRRCFVSYRISQLSPLTSTTVRLAVPLSTAPDDFRNVYLLRSWLEYDSAVDELGSRRDVRWYKVFGLLVMAGISVSFWTGVAWLIAYFLK